MNIKNHLQLGHLLNTKEQIANEIIKLSKLNVFDNTRKREYVEARALLCYILRAHKQMTYRSIVEFFVENNKPINHATIIHYINNFESYIKFNHKLNQMLNAVIMKMDKRNYKSRREFIKLKADVLSKSSIDTVLDLITKLHNKELTSKIERYEKQVQEFAQKGIT
jgi:hypothetical protein